MTYGVIIKNDEIPEGGWVRVIVSSQNARVVGITSFDGDDGICYDVEYSGDANTRKGVQLGTEFFIGFGDEVRQLTDYPGSVENLRDSERSFLVDKLPWGWTVVNVLSNQCVVFRDEDETLRDVQTIDGPI